MADAAATPDEAATPVESLDDAALRAEARRLRRLIDSYEARLARVAHELGRRRVPAADGRTDTSAWLVCETGMTSRQARASVALGSGLASAPTLASAVESGVLSPECARAVLGARTPATAAAWQRDQHQLVDMARRHRPDELARAMRHWKASVDPGGTDTATDAGCNTAGLAMVAGRGVLSADLDAESAAIVGQVMADVTDELWRASSEAQRRRRSAAWYRAEALVEMARRAQAADPATLRPAKPLLTVVVSISDLADPAGRLVELPTGELLGAEALRRMACDAGIARVITDPEGLPLEAGRSQRQPSAAQARAVLARDRGCGIADCNAPPWMCEIHHIRHWADGGPTDVANLVMVCRGHHRLVHEGAWTVGVRPGGGHELVRPGRARAA